jgi:probable O-glycosylation ligase (exosortase A-associated)
MPIRDVLVTLTVVAALPFCLARPWVGLLVWSWISYMNPHRLTWGFAHDLPFAMMVGLATLVGFPFAGDRKPVVWTRETLLLLLLWGWFTVTTVFAMYPESAWIKWEATSKSLLMAFLTIPLFQDRRRLRILLLVIAASIGFYGLKGGVFAALTGGQFMVLGPPGSFFEANTELALVLNMSIPISFYLAQEEERRWLRYLLRGTFVLTLLAIPFTYSRGGVVGLAVVLAVLFLRARTRLLLVPVAIAGVVAFVWLAPQQFLDRVQTLQNVEADGSAQLRLMSWRVGYEIALDRPVIGGGFQVFVHRETYDIYMPEYPRSFGHDAHSIYFNLLGEHGWIGLGLFIALVLATFGSLRTLRRTGASNPELAWVARYARMLQASLLAYLITGAFLSVAYFDLAYQLLIVVIILKGIVHERVPAPAPEATPAAMMRAAHSGKERLS